ncbi:MAG: D-tyrosyl-tRNA(Tyr) deacylase [Clostridiales bacterium]|nr:D-tyrosyl-tRNA(Tyr) deacylase [Clostridiales bacterium]MBR6484528.1 D-tyrosyl-tRNA(Tyr) deacylase [Clostridiales bacterium]
MRFVVQVVKEASVISDGELTGKIGKGYVVLIGVGKDDTKEIADKLIKKLMGLRIFKDENGKTNLSIGDVNGGMLLVSQFTLYADIRHGNRPSFINAGDPGTAEMLYDYIVDEIKKRCPVVGTGVFGAHMEVSLVNDGPFTIIMDSEDLSKN